MNYQKATFIKKKVLKNIMALTKQDKEIIKILVNKELEEMKSDAKKLMIINADFITKSKNSPNDLEFIKNEAKYEDILEKLKATLEK